jgi:hypothetical protein
MASLGGWRGRVDAYFDKRLCLPGVAVQTGLAREAVVVPSVV